MQTRLQTVAKQYGRDNRGRLRGGTEGTSSGRYLLSGFAKCAQCGGNLVVAGGQKHKHYYYGCSRHINRGLTACDNNLRGKMHALDAAVLRSIEGTVLTPEALERVVERAVHLIRERGANQDPARRKELREELRELNAELDRFVAVIAQGRAPDRILHEINAREQRINIIKAELAAYNVKAVKKGPDMRKLTQLARQFTELMYSDVPKARQALNKLLAGPITFVPKGRHYTFKGETRVGPLLYYGGTEERT